MQIVCRSSETLLLGLDPQSAQAKFSVQLRRDFYFKPNHVKEIVMSDDNRSMVYRDGRRGMSVSMTQTGECVMLLVLTTGQKVVLGCFVCDLPLPTHMSTVLPSWLALKQKVRMGFLDASPGKDGLIELTSMGMVWIETRGRVVVSLLECPTFQERVIKNRRGKTAKTCSLFKTRHAVYAEDLPKDDPNRLRIEKHHALAVRMESSYYLKVLTCKRGDRFCTQFQLMDWWQGNSYECGGRANMCHYSVLVQDGESAVALRFYMHRDQSHAPDTLHMGSMRKEDRLALKRAYDEMMESKDK